MLYDPKKFKPYEVDDKFGYDKNGYPGRPSALLRVGITCLKQRIAVDNGFEPCWTDNDACLAGSVWYFKEKEWPGCYQGNVKALSGFGIGLIVDGFDDLGIELPTRIPENIDVAPMRDTDNFIKDMTKMADMFEKAGF